MASITTQHWTIMMLIKTVVITLLYPVIAKVLLTLVKFSYMLKRANNITPICT